MKTVDHRQLFDRIASELPSELLEHVFVAGSLAAACHFADTLEGRGVKTKDADLVIHPGRDVESAARIARTLLANGWRPRDDCFPKPQPDPADELRAIRLYPPDHSDYFVELLNVPQPGEAEAKSWVAIQLDDGWYGLPSFEFLALLAVDREKSEAGLEYATPCMMALANLLSHPELGTARMSTPIDDRSILRSAKDLGRVLALASLAGDDETETWAQRWRFALETCYPDRWHVLAARVGDGLRALLLDSSALEEAWFTCTTGLLSGKNVTLEQLRATAERLIADCIEPLQAEAQSHLTLS
jgi:hypothetical protein